MEPVTIEFMQTKEYLLTGVKLVSERVSKGGKKRMFRLGILALLVTAIFLGVCIWQGKIGDIRYILFLALVLVMGLYCVLFFPLFYNKSLIKSVDTNFEKFNYADKTTKVTLLDELIEIDTPEGEYKGNLDQIIEATITPDYIWLRDSFLNCITIGKTLVDAEIYETFGNELERICKEYNKPFERIAADG